VVAIEHHGTMTAPARQPIGLRLFAIAVAWASFGMLPLALLALLPHADFPFQPLPAVVGLAASVSGFVLSRLLWGRRPGASRWLAGWAALVVCFMLFWPSLAAPGPGRRGATVGVALGAAAVVAFAAAASRRLRASREDTSA
jgi:hypothetical protein